MMLRRCGPREGRVAANGQDQVGQGEDEDGGQRPLHCFSAGPLLVYKAAWPPKKAAAAMIGSAALQRANYQRLDLLGGAAC